MNIPPSRDWNKYVTWPPTKGRYRCDTFITDIMGATVRSPGSHTHSHIQGRWLPLRIIDANIASWYQNILMQQEPMSKHLLPCTTNSSNGNEANNILLHHCRRIICSLSIYKRIFKTAEPHHTKCKDRNFNQQSKSTANEDTQNANQVTVEQQQSSASQTSAFIQDEIDRFRTSLADPLSHDEKLQATNRLHNIIRSTQRREVRESLRQELLSVIDSNRSKDIVKSAIFDYTRSLNSLDNASEAIRVLDLGLKNGILTTAEYAGESIHMGFLFDDKAMIKNGLNTGDEYSNIVLYNYISGITESNGKRS